MVFFGSPIAMAGLKNKTPAQWWESYGDEHPELQNFAIRVLSLTCSSSGCERNWSAFEMIHTKRRNRLKQKTMNDVVFVMTNAKLAKKKKTRKVAEYNIDDIESDDEWIVQNGEGSSDILDFTLDNEELEVDTQNLGEEAAAQGVPTVATQEDLVFPNLDDEVDREGAEDNEEWMMF